MIIHGDHNVPVPAHRNFGKFILHNLRNSKPLDVCLENYNTGEQLTYSAFIEYAVSLSVALSELGVMKGDIVGVGSERRITVLPTTLAVILAGAASTTFDLRTGRAVLRHKLNLTKPSYFICSNLFWEAYGDIIKDCGFIKTLICFEDNKDINLTVRKMISRSVEVDTFEPAVVEGQTDIALILYSSGTTGMPKGVLVTHLNCIFRNIPDRFQNEFFKTELSTGDWFHSYQIFRSFACLCDGRKVVFSASLKPDLTDEFFKIVEDCQVNSAVLGALYISNMAKAEDSDKYNLTSLQIIYSGGSPLNSTIIKKVTSRKIRGALYGSGRDNRNYDSNISKATWTRTWIDHNFVRYETNIGFSYQCSLSRFPNLKSMVQVYGMTEAGKMTTESWGTKGFKAGSVGMACPGTTLKIVDPKTRKILGSNQQGEICVRSESFMKGYIGMDMSAYLDEDGFFSSGDLGFYDEDKYFYIVDRMKDVFYYTGFQVNPLELENILMSHPGVREAAVVGKPAGVFGEEPAAFIVRQPGTTFTDQDLVDYVAPEVSPWMQLRGGVKFVSELPRSMNGKILRGQLREILIKKHT